MSTRPDPFAQLMKSGRAATIVLIALLAVCYVISWATNSTHGEPAMFTNFVFHADWSKPWTVLLYPMASTGDGNNFVWQLLLLWWLYWVGGDIEQSIGSGRLLAMFWIASLIGGLAVYCAILINHQGLLYGSVVPVGALTVAWGVRNPGANVRMMGVLPISGKWIAIIEVGIVLFIVGNGAILAGFFALIPLGLAALFAADMIPFLPYGRGRSRRESKVAKATERRDKSYYDDVYRRAKEREEQDKLRKLFERSLNDDDK